VLEIFIIKFYQIFLNRKKLTQK